MDLTMKRELARQIAGLSEPSPRGEEQFRHALEQIRVFQIANQRRPEPMAHAVEEAGLGRWLEAQRGEVRRGTLSETHRSLLDEALGPDWKQSALTASKSPETRSRASSGA